MYNFMANDIEYCRSFVGEIFEALGIPFNINDLMINIIPNSVNEIWELDYTSCDAIFGDYYTPEIKHNLLYGRNAGTTLEALLNNIRSGGVEFNKLPRLLPSIIQSKYEVGYKGKYVTVPYFSTELIYDDWDVISFLRDLLLLIGVSEEYSFNDFVVQTVPLRVNYRDFLSYRDEIYITSRIPPNYGAVDWENPDQFFEEFEEYYLVYLYSEYADIVQSLIPYSFNILHKNKKFRFPSHAKLHQVRR